MSVDPWFAALRRLLCWRWLRDWNRRYDEAIQWRDWQECDTLIIERNQRLKTPHGQQEPKS